MSTQIPLVIATTITLTNDQILALPNSPVEVVPAPGAGKMIFPMGGFFRFDFSAGPYTNVGTQAVTNWVMDADGDYDECFSETPLHRLDGGESNTTVFGNTGPYTAPDGGGNPHGADFNGPNADWENKPLSFAVYNTSGDGSLGNFTGGNAANSAKLTVIYVVLDV